MSKPINLMARRTMEPRSVGLTGMPLAEEYVCWSRMQAEAGQPLERIIARKELERRAGGGLFMWGVGNAPAVISSTLARAGYPVRAVFSIMKSKPKAGDVTPATTLIWRSYIDAQGIERPIPRHVVITSRGDSGLSAKRAHYALMCWSEVPLRIDRGGAKFDPSAYRNASGVGAPVGASQVTALLRRTSDTTIESSYEVNLSAMLASSYWVRLTDPCELPPSKRVVLDRAADLDANDWLNLANSLRKSCTRRTSELANGLLL